MKESSLQRSVLRRLRKQSKVWINKSPSLWDPGGIVDLIGCVVGRFVAIELKKPGKRPTPAQWLFLRRVHREGGIAIFADTWEAIETCLAAGKGNVV